MKKTTIILVAVAVLSLSVAVYYNMHEDDAAPEVREARVTRGDIVESVGATGTLEAVTTVQVGTQVSGTIKELYADFNSIVRRGQVLARLDPSLFQTQIDQANANLVRAQADVERLRVALEDARTKFERAKELAARQLIPRSELDTAEVNVKAAEAQLRSAQAQVTQARATLNQNQVNLQHTVITAPIDGIVIARNVDVGQTVAASMQAPTLFLLAADLTKMKVNASVDEADVGRIRPQQRVRFRVDAYPTEEFDGTVQQVRLQPVVVQNVVTYATVIDVPNRNLKLKPGMTANVTLEIARRNGVLRVPNAALRFRPTPEIFAALGQTSPDEPQRQASKGGDADRGRTGTTGSANGSAPTGNGEGQLREGRGQEGPQLDGIRADPERRRQFRERLERMPPEERERLMQRMRERGFGSRDGGPEARNTAPRDTAEGGAVGAGASRPGGSTIDSLFGPLPTNDSYGRVWVYVGGQLKMVRVRLGVSDGTQTELLSGNLSEGADLVTGVVLESEPAPDSRSGTGRSPLMGPDRRQRTPVRNAAPGGGERR